jgi:molybdate transport system substrate-binding protein
VAQRVLRDAGGEGRVRKTGALMRGLLLSFILAALALSQACADETRALVTIGMQRLFEDVRPAFETAYGEKLRVEYASTLDIAKRVAAGEIADFVITSRAGVDSLIKAGSVAADRHFALVGSSVAVAVPAGRPKPDISTIEAVKRALLAARTVSFTDPASGGPSGVHLEKVLDQLGIAKQVAEKTRHPPAGGAVGDILAKGEADIGIQQMAELSSFDGVDVVGPLPNELQSITEYEIAVPVGSAHPAAGKALLEVMRSPTGVAAITARRLDPR